jgi:hypothetical protein
MLFVILSAAKDLVREILQPFRSPQNDKYGFLASFIPVTFHLHKKADSPPVPDKNYLGYSIIV